MSVKGSETPPIIENKTIYGSYQDDDILVMSMEDMIKGATKTISIQPSDLSSITSNAQDVTIKSAYYSTGVITIGTNAITPNPDYVGNMKAFKCPSCGGNSFTVKDGVARCDYCGTMFTR